MFPKKRKVSGKPCDRAHSFTLTTRCCSGCNTRPYRFGHVERLDPLKLKVWEPITIFQTCLPIGSGFVTVVLKNPSQDSLPYSPAQWLCLLPVWGRHHGISVPNCLSVGSQGRPSAHEHTPRNIPLFARPFFLSLWVYFLEGVRTLYSVLMPTGRSNIFHIVACLISSAVLFWLNVAMCGLEGFDWM